MPNAHTESLNIGYYLTLVSRHRWVILVSFILTMIVGIVLSIKLPKIYEASTLILVQPQRVPEKIVTPVVDTDLYDVVTTLSQQILSRSNLERIISRYKLFDNQEGQSMLDEEKIEILRKQIKVELGRTKDRLNKNSFSIAVQDKDPKTAMKVANGLAEVFMEENLKLREDQATGTTDFLESELKIMRKRLQEVEQSLIDFRETHRGMLPDELETNLRILDRLNDQLNQKEANLRSARTSLVAINTDAAARINNIREASEAAARINQMRSANSDDDEKDLGKLREKLSELMLRYKEQHPDVIRLKASIEKLEAEASTKPDSGSSQSTDSSLSSSGRGSPNDLYIRQRIELSGTIKGIETDIDKIKENIRVYEKRVEETSKYGQELMNLQRDYDNMRHSYNSLLNRKLEADIAVNMEKKQKGEQFMIIDVARLPEKPIFPKMPRLFIITVAAGLGLGAGLIFLLEILDVSVRRIDKLEEDIGLPVLSMVPRIFTSKDRRRHRLVLAATTVSVIVAIALAGAFAMLVFHGIEPTLKLL